MNIKQRACGAYQTNCYIIDIDSKQIIIDPGVDAAKWVQENVTNPVAILNTHGHFDHVWSNDELKKRLNIPVYAPKDDVFMINQDPFGQGTPPSEVDVEVDGDSKLVIEGISVEFTHLPGHTPGCSVIEIEDAMFSGDFVFKGSIGRVDFPYSDPQKMKQSIEKFLQIPYNKTVYPGHGETTTIKAEQRMLPAWLRYI